MFSKETIAEIRSNERVNEPYFRISESDGKLSVVTMQWFDEFDVDPGRFMTDESGSPLKFTAEGHAVEWLHANVKPHLIDERHFVKPRDNRSYYLR